NSQRLWVADPNVKRFVVGEEFSHSQTTSVWIWKLIIAIPVLGWPFRGVDEFIAKSFGLLGMSLLRFRAKVIQSLGMGLLLLALPVGAYAKSSSRVMPAKFQRAVAQASIDNHVPNPADLKVTPELFKALRDSMPVEKLGLSEIFSEAERSDLSARDL